METNFIQDDHKPDIFEYLASLNDLKLMNEFYSDASCCICTFRFLEPIAKGIIYKMMFLTSSISLKDVIKKWPEAKNKDEIYKFDCQINKLKRLQILREEKNGTDIQLKLNPIFCKNILQVLTSDHKLTLIREKSVEKQDLGNIQNELAREKVERIVYFLLGRAEIQDFSEFLLDLLRHANLILKTGEGHQLTVDGFKFMLEDISTQIHILLLNYIRMKQCSPDHLKLIFQLILSNNKSYRIIGDEDGMNFETVSRILYELKQIGLIYMKKKKRFYITQLMRWFLLGLDSTEATKSLIRKDMDRSIIVETNFRVYWYSQNVLNREIMMQFVEVDVVFPNLIGGTLTRSKARDAFRKGITAHQISVFLTKHAHEQMYIKKDVEEEKEDPTGILVDSKEQVKEKKKKLNLKGTNAKASVIPSNVIQQVHIWEEEMNTINSQEGLLIRDFEGREKYIQFLQYWKRNKIPVLSRSERQQLAVVPYDKQKDVYDFLNRH